MYVRKKAVQYIYAAVLETRYRPADIVRINSTDKLHTPMVIFFATGRPNDSPNDSHTNANFQTCFQASDFYFRFRESCIDKNDRQHFTIDAGNRSIEEYYFD